MSFMKLRDILEVTVPGLGYELVDIEITPAKLVRIFIDKENGVTIDDCELVSNHLSRLFVVEEVEYNRLEVSSPGLERPLKKLQDFVRFNGKIAKIKSHELINGEKVFQGIILGVNGDIIQLKLANDTIMEIEFAAINRARLVFEDKKPLKSK